MGAKVFVASAAYEGDLCHICQRPIHRGDRIQFYMGPFVMHEVCVKDLGHV